MSRKSQVGLIVVVGLTIATGVTTGLSARAPAVKDVQIDSGRAPSDPDESQTHSDKPVVVPHPLLGFHSPEDFNEEGDFVHEGEVIRCLSCHSRLAE